MNIAKYSRAPSPPGLISDGTVKAKGNSRSHAENVFDQIEIDTDSETDDDSTISDIRELFNKARHLLCPSAFYRQITYLYAERKLMVFFLVHFVSTFNQPIPNSPLCTPKA
mmetsp:Transcript_30985/g.74535  ORF Transcript_30985/g.74535 Transcript_30985/m.74535 type:complete len:111 (-) Transcript_30985:3984-4316(-)